MTDDFAATVVQQVAGVAGRVAAGGLDDDLRHDVARRYLDLQEKVTAALTG